MALFFENWDSSLAVDAISSVVSFLVVGFVLGCACWLAGFVVVSVFRLIKGGV